MIASKRSANLLTLAEALPPAETDGYALGSFSPRTTAMIRPILAAGRKTRSPLIVQISQKELQRYGITPEEFAAEFRRQFDALGVDVPVVLHLDHTRDLAVIREAIAAGFTSVMIDASELPLEENMPVTAEVVQYAHARGVSVEAELGRIGTTDSVETEADEEMYTDPEEAARFAGGTWVDALAVSVGTAHGVYTVRQPKIDYERLRAIRARTRAHLVLHGGSGVPAKMMAAAIRLPGGGVSKVNIATDLELAALHALGRTERLSNAEMNALPAQVVERARAAVERTVVDKITNFVHSHARADGANA